MEPHRKRTQDALAAILLPLRLFRRAQRRLNEATHGALGLNTVIKAVAWLGLCGVVFLLLHKVHQIQQELDPVGRGLIELQKELSKARTTVTSDTQLSRQELEALTAHAKALDEALDQSSEDQKRLGAPSLAKANVESKALADALAGEEKALADITLQREALAGALADYQLLLKVDSAKLVQQTSELVDGGAAAVSALRGLGAQIDGESSALKAATLASEAQSLSTGMKAMEAQLQAMQQQIDQAQGALRQVVASGQLAGLRTAMGTHRQSPPDATGP